DLLEGLDPSGWDAPTGSAGWSVHDVAAHLGHLEGFLQGFPQPETPDGFDRSDLSPLDAITGEGVAARRSWSHAEVLDEIRDASSQTMETLDRLDEAGWTVPTLSPVGMIARSHAQDLRLADLWVHLNDMRFGLGLPLTPDTEPLAAAAAIARAVRLTPWGSVKRAGLVDGSTIGLQLSGPSGFEGVLAVADGRGSLVPGPADMPDRVAGPGLAFLMAAGGRAEMIDAAGGLDVSGPAAGQLIARYRIFE
ncbi:maleylpyruvate isomerase family mycothiol-dependent enzyme, partial [bacterium]|nr:maleylpyruvate isomerase family mycothiol-dependent enzyme [bacterium]